MLKKRNKKYIASILCDDEITTEIIKIFSNEKINFQRIRTGTAAGTDITIEMEK